MCRQRSRHRWSARHRPGVSNRLTPSYPYLQRLPQLLQPALGGAIGREAGRGATVGACGSSRRRGGSPAEAGRQAHRMSFVTRRGWGQQGSAPGCPLVPAEVDAAAATLAAVAPMKSMQSCCPHLTLNASQPTHPAPPRPTNPFTLAPPTCAVHVEDVAPRWLLPHHPDSFLAPCMRSRQAGRQAGGQGSTASGGDERWWQEALHKPVDQSASSPPQCLPPLFMH